MKNREDIHGGNPSAITERLGIKNSTDVKYDFSVNINPLGMPIAVERTIAGMSNADFSNYPEIHAESTTAILAKAHSLPPETILLGNGSTELFLWIILSRSPKKAHIIAPCYSGYAEICHAAGIKVEIAKFARPQDCFQVDLESIDYSGIELIFIATPNNPTGTIIPKEQILSTAQKNPDTFFVIDESFVDFLPESNSIMSSPQLPANIAVVKSLTKFFAIAGIRLGMLYSTPETVAKFAKRRLPWSVNSLAQKIAPFLYADNDYILNTRSKICELRKELSANLATIKGIKVFPANANFILCQLTAPSEAIQINVLELQKKLLQHGIMIRSCSDVPGLNDSFFRIAVLSKENNDILINHLNAILNASPLPPDSDKADAIMVVGTTSDAGKSVLAAALCRYFYNKGVAVAPFKAQNMSLNSFVTREGGEMGRAQVVQAEAANIEPHTDMNPVLLKPTGESGSQLIINGKAICNVTARSYYEEKCEIRKDAQAAYDRLAAQYDMIIIEGAGSPAEINLQKQDFVNMAMAEYANAQTILVADINPGGVFAAIYGTLKLIPHYHRKFLRGIIINKFRGDVSLLKEGIEEIEKLTGVPVLGVLPYIPNLNIEAEDSMSLDSPRYSEPALDNEQALIDIAVIRLPRISNFTDFMPLESIENVSLRYVSTPEKLGTPDLLIIPGSKNTIADMKFLHESGLEKEIYKLRNSQMHIIGICGGFQMLGQSISDPHSVEGADKSIKALNLLPIKTVLSPEKKLTQVKGIISNFPFSDTSTPFEGYEIHAGETVLTDIDKHIQIMRGEDISEEYGYFTEDKKVTGTYIHGLFDSEQLRSSLLNYLAKHKRVDSELNFSNTKSIHKDKVYDDLAEMIEKYIDLEKILERN